MWLRFDRYERKARLAPAVIVVLPLAIAAYTWFRGELIGLSALSSLGMTGVVATALALLMSQIARAMGKAKEPALFKRWGGSPTVRLLRHRGDGVSPITRQRYHSFLSNSLGGHPIPTPGDEEADPSAADEVYGACVDRLIALTREGSQFPLVAEENRNYGFHRNLWGMKPMGVAICVVSIAVVAADWAIEWRTAGKVHPVSVVAALFAVAMLGIWLLVVTPNWVRVPANAYAKALLSACEKLGDPAR